MPTPVRSPPHCHHVGFPLHVCTFKTRATRATRGVGLKSWPPKPQPQKSKHLQAPEGPSITPCRLPGRPLCAALEGTSPGQDPRPSEDGSRQLTRIVKLCAGVCLCAALCTGLASCMGKLGSLAAGAAADASRKGLSLAAQCAWAGLSAGCLHTLAGPDHLAGLAPLTLGQNQYVAAVMGGLWGFGHSSAQFILGLVFIFLKERFQEVIPILSKWSGAVVGLTLITIGVLGLQESLGTNTEEHEYEVTGQNSAGALQATRLRRVWGTYFMGFMHGLQPDSLFVVLPALTLPTRLAATAYITMFVLGTILSMGGYSLAIGTASQAAKEKPWLSRNLSTLTSLIAMVVGLMIILSGIGFQIPLIS